MIRKKKEEKWSDPEANNKIIKHGPIKIIFNVFSPFNFAFLLLLLLRLHLLLIPFLILFRFAFDILECFLLILPFFITFTCSLTTYSPAHSFYCFHVHIGFYDTIFSFLSIHHFPFIPIRFNWEIAMFWGYWKLNLMAVAKVIDCGWFGRNGKLILS